MRGIRLVVATLNRGTKRSDAWQDHGVRGHRAPEFAFRQNEQQRRLVRPHVRDEVNTSRKILRKLAVFRPLFIARTFFSCIG
jgi:hypothetical protein